MFNQYPYLNLNDLNLDYLLNEIKSMYNDVTNFVSINAIKYADPIQWNITRQYEKNTVVIDPLTGTAYISVAPVPSGVALTREEYWTVVFDLGSFVTRAAQNFTRRWESDTTLTATFSTPSGSWLVWGDVLYKALTNITAGDTYVIGSNIEHFTIEELYNSVINLIQANYDAIVEMIGDLDDLSTEEKGNIVGAINEIVSNIGKLNDLQTENKDSIVAAINETNTKITDLSNRETNKIANVLDFGAVGDNVTDDTQAIKNALNSDAYLVYFPSGYTFYVSSYIDIPNHRYLYGGGVIDSHNDDIVPLNVISHNATEIKTDIVIDGLTICNNRAPINVVQFADDNNTTNTLVYDITIKNCTCYNSATRGLNMGYSGSDDILNGIRPRITVDHCHIYNITGIAICCSHASVNIRDCRVHGSTLESITIDNGCRFCHVENNILFNSATGYGVIGMGKTVWDVDIINNNIICDTTFPTCIGVGATDGGFTHINIEGNSLTGTLIFRAGANGGSARVVGNSWGGVVSIQGIEFTNGPKIYMSGNDLHTMPLTAIINIAENAQVTDYIQDIDLTSYVNSNFTIESQYHSYCCYIIGKMLYVSARLHKQSAIASGDVLFNSLPIKPSTNRQFFALSADGEYNNLIFSSSSGNITLITQGSTPTTDIELTAIIPL